MKSTTIPAAEAKLHFGDWLNRCAYGGEEIVITRHDKPVAVLVGIEEWKLSQKRIEERSAGGDPRKKKYHPLVERMIETCRQMYENVPPEKLKNDVDAVTLVRRIREEGYEK